MPPVIESENAAYTDCLRRLKANPQLSSKIALLESKAHIYVSAGQRARNLRNADYAAKTGNLGTKGSWSDLLLGHTHCSLPAFEITLDLASDRKFLLQTFGIETTLDNILAHELGHIYSYLQGVTGATNNADALYWENSTRTGAKRRYHN